MPKRIDKLTKKQEAAMPAYAQKRRWRKFLNGIWLASPHNKDRLIELGMEIIIREILENKKLIAEAVESERLRIIEILEKMRVMAMTEGVTNHPDATFLAGRCTALSDVIQNIKKLP